MRFTFYFAIVLVIMIAACNQLSGNYGRMEGESFNIMSYNIRYATEADSLNAWDYRKERVVNLVQFHEADIIGMQEALLSQIQYVAEQLPDYKWCGVGRDDGKEAGEFSPIFYNTNLFTLLEDSTFWLSESPEAPSKSWDAALNRIVTWAKFTYKPTGDDFYFFNTHFDHRGQIAREESAKLLVLKITEIVGSEPVILTGDFNSTPDSFPYTVIAGTSESGSGAVVPLKDAFHHSELPHHGALRTYSGFAVNDSLPGDRIDYIFVRNNINVLKHGILTDFREGRYPSDHLPVIARVVLP